MSLFKSKDDFTFVKRSDATDVARTCLFAGFVIGVVTTLLVVWLI